MIPAQFDALGEARVYLGGNPSPQRLFTAER
jgi:hypothetical protein